MSLSHIAIIADIHANIWALDAVLQDIKRREIQQIINLGDSLYGPLAPVETAERLLGEDLLRLTIQGNEDRILFDPSVAPSPTVTWVKKRLSEAHLTWLNSLPTTAVLDDDVFLCHGTPESDETYLLEEPSIHGSTLASAEQISALLGAVSQRLVLCAHSHFPRTIQLPDGRLIINPGSVGLPAYQDEAPFPHKMENGSPHARYAIISKDAETFIVNHVLIPYDWHTAARIAHENGRDDWAQWLALGRA
ncbi:MAG TPA: metallophosphoesterase family protein [Ktedonobacteraceae bacterium]|jgi:diadenosine tetraphosphatase ApaH/serine/threonine PP2A family protein phosphatase|nr:metallophosphoesterase family protein [Ktedonobacteraceae bacterium]